MHIYLRMSENSSTFAPAFRRMTRYKGVGKEGTRYLSSGGRAMD